jgi:hypothetical protein
MADHGREPRFPNVRRKQTIENNIGQIGEGLLCGASPHRRQSANVVEKHSFGARRCSRERLAVGGSVKEETVIELATLFFANSDCHARHFSFC